MSRRVAFIFFSAAFLLAMVREWNAPLTCRRDPLFFAASAKTGQ
jgi:hypothetical protein